MNNLLTQFKDYIKTENLIEKGESVILGVSGGPDSLMMLDLFARIKDEFCLELTVFHLNHMFRKEAYQEALYVEKKAKNYDLNVIVEEFDVPKYIEEYSLSVEEGAREVRFRLISKWAKKLAIKKIAMAHNKDDLVETVFLNLFRGTGLKGLAGIAPLTQNAELTVIHPLLNFLRVDIESYCQKMNLNPCLDPSNRETIYTRNKIRNKLIPQIEEEINPKVKEVVYRMATNIREEEEFLASLSYRHFVDCLLEKRKERLVLSLPKLQKEEPVLRRRIIKNAISQFCGNAVDLYSVHYQVVDELIMTGQTGKFISLKDDLKVRRSYDKLIFENNDYKGQKDFLYRLTIPGNVKFSNYIIETNIINKDGHWRQLAGDRKICLCDLAKIKGPLVVRNRQKGDSFYPFGMNGSKKLKDYLIDEKIPLVERDRIPLVVDKSGKIIWVTGYRSDERFKVEDSTEKILKIGIIYTGGD